MSQIIFLDIETTGLNPQVDCILEVGCVVYDIDKWAAVAQQNWVVYFDSEDEENLVGVDPYVIKMHTNNGLWKECLSGQRTIDVEFDVLNWIQQQGVEKGPMAGNSVHFDRSFLAERMPKILEAFTHRLIDVSSYNEACRLGAFNYPTPDKGVAHRSIPDCLDSIRQLEWHRSHLSTDQDEPCLQ